MGSHATEPAPLQHIHRLRDLCPRDRLIALALALALLVAPVSSALRNFNSWTPTGDNALIELRASDVATKNTPLIGQPSSSSLYGQRERNAAHPGPMEFYLLAPAERLIGGGVGMLSTTALITAMSVLVAAWAVFRQLGSGAGLAAAVALAALLWTTGAAVMVDPISSSIGRFPLLCSVVLLWCLLCGDVRLFAVTCAFVSFTLQQHLSVVPVTVVVSAVGIVGLIVTLVRRGVLHDQRRRREAQGSLVLGAVVALVLWAPVLYEQFSRSPGNLTRIARYAGDKSRSDVGFGSALRQLAHAVGLPPFLGRTNILGPDLLAPVSLLTGVTALLAVALLVAGAITWRKRNPRLAGLVVMAGAVAVGGLLNGSNVPNSLEQIRIAFYHWTFTLAFLELLILLVAVGPVVWRRYTARDGGREGTRPLMVRTLVGPAVLLVVLAPALGNLAVSRTDNRLLQLIPKQAVDRVDREARTHLAEIRQPTLVLATTKISFSGIYEGIAARLVAAGIDIRFPADTVGYVSDHRLVDYRTVRSGIVVAFGVGGSPEGIPGTTIATANPAPNFDRKAFALLLRQARSASKVVLGRPLELELERQSKQRRSRPGLTLREKQLFAAGPQLIKASLASIIDKPAKVLASEANLRLLAKTPMAEPALDHQALERVLRTYPTEQGVAMTATHLSVHLLNRQQLLQYAPPP